MITRAPRRNTLALTAVLGVAAATVACSGAEDPADMHPAESSAMPGTSSSSNVTPSPDPLVAGGMDSGGSDVGPPNWNESPDGQVTTTLGEFVVGVRSTSPIQHRFQEAMPGAPERMRVTFVLATADGRKVTFDFDYTGGQRTFSLADVGQFKIVKNGESLYGRAGTVTIAPVEADALRVSFEQIAVGPVNEAGEAEAGGAVFIENGVIEGPLRRQCTRAADVTYGINAAQAPTPAPLHDEAWIARFCSTATD